MAEIKRTFVSTNSPTAARNVAGFNPSQALYFAPVNEMPPVALIRSH